MKEGDKVLCIKASVMLELHKVYTVTNVSIFDGTCLVNGYWYPITNFRVLNEKERLSGFWVGEYSRGFSPEQVLEALRVVDGTIPDKAKIGLNEHIMIESSVWIPPCGVAPVDWESRARALLDRIRNIKGYRDNKTESPIWSGDTVKVIKGVYGYDVGNTARVTRANKYPTGGWYIRLEGSDREYHVDNFIRV